MIFNTQAALPIRPGTQTGDSPRPGRSGYLRKRTQTGKHESRRDTTCRVSTNCL
ncbi:hypothetical protein KsCSTR_00420 [Candidatus Kuenenia stuttgartiensis]|uniref:Uncharacterized protein n=1 Tax=Kuenenia stuttgartiensis TaxID=174633 RepID=Q1PV85_KUEST|nr:hypothetical protein KsCSTR_00420 [Candidatus Kuenenia stuttgartiensis]CAJ71144.1 unknown protein [Candidatus Kuenenia stuttgartiensis]